MVKSKTIMFDPSTRTATGIYEYPVSGGMQEVKVKLTGVNSLAEAEAEFNSLLSLSTPTGSNNKE